MAGHGRTAFALLSTVAVTAWSVYDVMQFGAVGDGVTSDTAAIRAALEAARVAGGATVVLPSGYTFLSGSVNVSSNTELRVEGTFLASPTTTLGDYVLVPPLPWYGGGQDAQESGAPEWISVIRSFNTVNVSIRGGGTIDGNGGAADGWWACFHATPALGPPPCAGYSRPQLVRFVHAVAVVVENVTLVNSPAWTLHIANVTNARIRNLRVLAPADQGNTDGVDIDCSQDVVVSGMYYAGAL